MKKLFFAIAALAVMTSCNNDELVEVTPKQAISFGNAFVDNATRAIDKTYNSSNKPSSFHVYGTTQGDEVNAQLVSIFDYVGVSSTNTTGVGDDYFYDSKYTQYWIEKNKYNFSALVHAEKDNVVLGEDKLPSKVKFTSNGDIDLLYAKSDEITPSSESYNTPVEFTFEHLLSKLHISFSNTITSNTDDLKYEYKVTDVNIINAISSAECDFSTKKWSNHSDTDQIQLSFGNISNASSSNISEDAIFVDGGKTATSTYSKLIIPGTYNGVYPNPQIMDLSFYVETFINKTSVDKRHHKLTIKNKFEAGKAYNLIISKGAPGEVIKFSVKEVNEWITDHNGDGITDDKDDEKIN